MKAKPLTTILLLFHICGIFAQTASFNSPDTACVNAPITFTNTSNPNHTFQWNFCTPKFDTIVQEAGITGNLDWPQSSTYIEANGKYYGFAMTAKAGSGRGIVRMDFGNSLSNTPTYTALGNFGGMIDIISLHDIQIIRDNGNFYLFVCGYKPEIYNDRQTIVRIDLGNSVESITATATDISPHGNLEGPASMSFARTNEGWFALVANRSNFGSLLLLNFGKDIKSIPRVTNYGNMNNAFYNPNSVALLIEKDGIYALFVALGRVYKLVFGNSLLNTPTIIPVRTPDLDSIHAWKLSIAKDCNYTYCFVTPTVKEKIVRLNFSSLATEPTSKLLEPKRFFPNQHNLSNIISDGTISYFFVSKIDVLVGTSSDTLFRFRFNTCSGSELPVFDGFQPPPVKFSKPGHYTISLVQDKNLTTESVFCKDIVITEGGTHSYKAVSFCKDDSIQLRPSFRSEKYLWSNSTTDSLLVVHLPGNYWIKGDDLLCGASIDSFTVSIHAKPEVSITKSNDIDCSTPTAILTATGASAYKWQPASFFENITDNPQTVSLDSTTSFTVTGTNNHLCSSTASVIVKVDFSQSMNLHLVPNAFTPNNDGLNDCFSVKHWGDLREFNLKIFNRWGQIVFESMDSKQCWNGKYKTGQIAEIGTYSYLITGTSYCEGYFRKHGTFQLIR